MKHNIPTPSMAHATFSDWEKVYEPAEDSFLLIDALEEDMDFIRTKKPSVCVEVGCGSGIVITALASQVAACCLAVDLNMAACLLSQRTAAANGVQLDVLQSDLLSSFRLESIDLVVFNPPYVATSDEEMKMDNILSRAWAGGQRGRAVTDRFLNTVVPSLRPGGFGYLLLLRDNNPDQVKAILEQKGCQVVIVKERKLRGEFLVVLRFLKLDR